MDKGQFVIACIEDEGSANAVLSWARYMAEHLRHKELMVLHVKQESGDAPEWLKALGVPYVSMTGDWGTAIEGLPTAFNGILAVTTVDPTAPRAALSHPKTLLHEFKGCKIAYLCVHTPLPSAAIPLASCLTLTHRREGKEKLVWSSYLARFLGSTVTIAHPHYRDQGLYRQLQNNMQFVEKVFRPLNIDYRLSQLSTHSWLLSSPDLAALDQLQPDLLVARTSDVRERDLLDLLTPLPELRLLSHPSRIPILFLNPRDDLYILCD